MTPEDRRAYNTAWSRARRARRTPEEHERDKARSRAYNARRMLDPAYAAEVKAKKRAAGRRLAQCPTNRRKRANKHLVQKYGLTIEQRNAMLAKQGGGCALCGATNMGGKRWHVDHDHETNEVRGVVCAGCNIAIGQYEKIKRTFGIARVESYLPGWPSGDDMSAVRSA